MSKVFKFLAFWMMAVAVAPIWVAAQTPYLLKRSVTAPPIWARNAANLGNCLALAGDTLAVGAQVYQPGSAPIRVFHSQTGKLLYFILNPEPGAYLGSSVALSGSRLVAGSPVESNGSVFIYEAAGGQATLVTVLRNPHPGSPNPDFS